MFDFAKAIECIGEAFKSGFSYAEESKERQSESQIIKDKKRLKEATNIAEKIFEISDKYKNYYTAKDLKNYEKLMKDFDKKD